MNIVLLENSIDIRQAFISKFTVQCESENLYDQRYLWELMDCRAISFSKSLELLRAIHGNVYFMSESEIHYCHKGIKVDGIEHRGCVAKMNAKELADLIEYEWNEGWRLSALDIYLDNTVLPPDLYVFDESMERLIVFTHESDAWDFDEQPMKAAASRICKMYGFILPEGVPYEKIKAMFEKDLAPNSSLEIEMSYSSHIGFRQFIVSKWTNEDNTGYEYWFDFDSSNTDYSTWEEAENAKIFNGMSLKEISRIKDVQFDIIQINGNDYVCYIAG